MAKASPQTLAFSGGELSDLLDARTDIGRYATSLKSCINYVPTPQGPAVGRSGTAFVLPVSDESERAVLVPFVATQADPLILEFSKDRIRVFEEAGVRVHNTVVLDIRSTPGAVIRFNSPDIDALEGDEVVFGGLPGEFGLNGVVATITNKNGVAYTTDVVFPTDKDVEPGVVSRIFHVDANFTEAERLALRYEQSVDTLYLMTGLSRPRTFSQKGPLDWTLADYDNQDGPFLDPLDGSGTLTPDSTGNALPVMTSNTAPSGEAGASSTRPAVAGTNALPVTFLERPIGYGLGQTAPWHAFDEDKGTYWAANGAQEGILHYTPDTSFACDGYTIYVPSENRDSSYVFDDYAPSTFTFEGNTGATWVVLDTQDDYVLYERNKSVFFQIDNTTAYTAYRLNIKKLVRNGLIEPRVARFAMRSVTSSNITLTASTVARINDGQGFLSTDVGRLIRLQGSDQSWRSVKITTVNSTTEVIVQLLGEPLPDAKAIRKWRLGLWSDTTGWPECAHFFGDRLYFGGNDRYPDTLAFTVVGNYSLFSSSDNFGVVLSDLGGTLQLNARKVAKTKWISSDTRGVSIGTGSSEYIIALADGENFDPANPQRAKRSTSRGSYSAEPEAVDDQILFIKRGGRSLNEFSYVFEANGYRSPSMSQLAPHIGAKIFEEIQYAAEPYSVVWARRGDGSLVGLTYNREENVVGWHTHELSGGFVESIAVIPQRDQLQDALWLILRRVVNGVTRRYVERLMPFWDFNVELENAHFVDSALRYDGGLTSTIYGLAHLEGQTVYGLADMIPVGPLVVQDGAVVLTTPASRVLLGLGFESFGLLPKQNAGGADGTSQGKQKRVNSIVVQVWRSCDGEVGIFSDETGDIQWQAVQSLRSFSTPYVNQLHTGNTVAVQPDGGYDMEAYIAFRRPAHAPLPFNPAAILPQLHTQDR